MCVSSGFEKLTVDYSEIKEVRGQFEIALSAINNAFGVHSIVVSLGAYITLHQIAYIVVATSYN